MSDETQPGEDTAGPNDFDQAVEALMAKSQQATTPPDEEDDEVNEAPSDESDDADGTPTEEHAEAEDEEEDAADPEEDDEDEGEPDDEESDEPKATEASDEAVVQIGDETVTVADLKRGYLREADYTRKAQEAASVRRESERMLEGLNQHSQDVLTALTVAQELANMAVLEPPDPSLRETNPGEFAALMMDHQAAQRQLGDLQARVSRDISNTLAIRQKQEETRSAEELRARRDDLHKAVPELADPTKADEVRRGLAEVFRAVGIPAEEADQWDDPRIAHLAVLAARGLQAQKKAPKAKRKLDDAPKVLKQVPRKSKQSIRRDKLSQAEQRLKRVGSYEAAVEALLARNGLG